MTAILPDPAYNPELEEHVTSATRLGPGITVAKFLGSYGDRTSFRHVRSEEERKQIARNLYMHGLALNSINNNIHHFNDVRVIVSEGVYKGGPLETPAGLNKLKSTGRLAYYQVIDRKGRIDFEKTFDAAVFWKDHAAFDEMILDYDTYNPDGSLTVQIGLLMPEMPETWDAVFPHSIKTMFNNVLQSDGELIEILPETYK